MKCGQVIDYKAMDALSKIAELQPIVSSYFDASKMVMEDEIERKRKEIRFKDNERKTTESASWDDELPPPIL